jgi:hypothetical protein
MKVRSVRIPEEIDKAIDFVARSEKLQRTSSILHLRPSASIIVKKETPLAG